MRTFQALHKYYDDCFTNGEFDRDKIIKKELFKGPEYNLDRRIDMLEKLYKAVLSAKFMNEITIDYLVNSNRNYDDIIREYNEKKGIELDISSGRSRITFCQRKIADVFKLVKANIGGGEIEFNIVTWLFFGKAHMGVEMSEEKMELYKIFTDQYNVFVELYCEKSYIKKKDMLINLPPCSKVKELSDSKFNDFMDIIQPYSKFVLEAIQRQVDTMTEEVGYFRYLMSKTSKLNAVDIERKNIILRWLGIDDVEEIGDSYIKSIDTNDIMNNNESDSTDSVDSVDSVDSGDNKIIKDINDIF